MTDSRTRQPRPLVTVNGQPLSGTISLEVTSNSHFTADTYRLTLSIGALPSAFAPAYWADSQNDLVALSVDLDGTVQPLITGQVDDAEIDLVARTVTLTGRDLSSRFLDSKTAEKFQSKKSSEIAAILAARHGLQTDIAPTTARAGTFYQIDHAVLTREQTEWDLLVYLAEHEGYDVWVTGTTLHFQPTAVLGTPYPITWAEPTATTAYCVGNVLDLHLQRSQTIAKDIIVLVRSWNQKQQKGFTKTAKASQAKGQRNGGKAQTYTFIRPNLSPDQAQQLANSYLEQITRHERVITASLPGDTLLTTRTMVRLSGTGTSFDQDYYPDSITRRLSFDEGYKMDLRAKNHSTLSETTV